jgi:hypothetical protein
MDYNLEFLIGKTRAQIVDHVLHINDPSMKEQLLVNQTKPNQTKPSVAAP